MLVAVVITYFWAVIIYWIGVVAENVIKRIQGLRWLQNSFIDMGQARS